MELWEKKNVHNVAKKKKFDTKIYVTSEIQIVKSKEPLYWWCILVLTKYFLESSAAE